MSITEDHCGSTLSRLYSDFDVDKPDTSTKNKGFLNCDKLSTIRQFFGTWSGNLIRIKDTDNHEHLVSRKSLEKFLVRTASISQDAIEKSTPEELQKMLDSFVKATQENRAAKLQQEMKIQQELQSPVEIQTPDPSSPSKPQVSPQKSPQQPIELATPQKEEEKKEALPEATSPKKQIVPTETPIEPLIVSKLEQEEAKPEVVSPETSKPEPLTTAQALLLLQDKAISDESVIAIAEQLGPDIKARFDQLTTALKPGQFEKEALSLRKTLKQAIFIEETIQVNTVARKFLPREKGIAPRSIQIHDDGTQRIIAIIPKEQHASISAQGTSKKVLSAVAVPFERLQSSEPIVQITPLKESERKNDQRTQKEVLREIDKELEIYDTLEGIEGVASIISVADLTEGAKLPTKSILAKRASGGDLQKVIKEHKTIDLETQIAWTYRLVSTFADIHAKSVIHGDIKGDNLLLDENNMPLVTDFGMACTKKGGKGKDKDKIVPHDMYKQNLYGTMEYSAPELFCTDKGFTRTAQAIDYQKTESFALGAVVYAIMNKGEDLPWMAEIVAVRDSEEPDWDSQNEPLRNSMRDGLKTCVENPLKALPKESKKTREEHYKCVVYNLLRENPKERWTTAQAKAYMDLHL